MEVAALIQQRRQAAISCRGCGVSFLPGENGPWTYCGIACVTNKKRRTRGLNSAGYDEVFYNPRSLYQRIDVRLSLRRPGADDEFYNPKSPFAQHWRESDWFNPNSPFANRWRERFSEQHDIDAALDALIAKLPWVHPDIRADVRQELAVELLSGSIPLTANADEITRGLKRVRAGETSWWKHLSISAPVGNDPNAYTWGERLGLA